MGTGCIPATTEGRGSLCRPTVPHRTCPPGTDRPASTPAPPARRGAGRAGKGIRPGRERERERSAPRHPRGPAASPGHWGRRDRRWRSSLSSAGSGGEAVPGRNSPGRSPPLGFLPEPLPGLRQGFAVNRVSPVVPPSEAGWSARTTMAAPASMERPARFRRPKRWRRRPGWRTRSPGRRSPGPRPPPGTGWRRRSGAVHPARDRPAETCAVAAAAGLPPGGRSDS